MRARDSQPTDRELAMLADGTLPEPRRSEVEAQVAASPKLEQRLAEQRRALATIHRRTEPAPARLREGVTAVRRGAGPGAPGRRRLGLTAAVGVAVVLVALAASQLIPENGSGEPSVAEAAVLATRPPVRPEPGTYPGRPGLLHLEVEEVPFPSWSRFGWRAVGARIDRLAGRDTATLFYVKQGRRIGYTIVGGRALSRPGDAPRRVARGTELHSLRVNGRLVVTWRRLGHTCLLSARGVSRAELERLGSWRAGGLVPY